LETSRSLAISPNKQRFVLGTEWRLRGYDKDGLLVWDKAAPGRVGGMNIARGGALVVAAYGDGTIRWHRLSDGAELLALFVHKQDRRWVAWTPKGYYMASPGAESLIGWHVNRDWDEAARFYPVDRFRQQFNRPDIVKLVLETLDETKAIEEANKRADVKRADEDVRKIAPPIVTIQAPGNETPFRSHQVTINYDVFSATGKEITGVEVRVNQSKLRASFKPGDRKNKHYTSGMHVLSLQPRDVTITLVARDEDDRASEPVSIRLRWDGAKPGQIELPRLRALFVGSNAYPFGRLQFAAKDANDLAAFFKSHEGRSYSRVDTKVLADAKRADVIKGLEWLEQESEEGTDTDVNLLFLAGHGKSDAKQHFYYLSVDSDPDDLATTAVSKDHILRVIRNRKGAMVVMLDACHSGATSVDMNRAANELGDRTLGVQLYASSEGRQYSLERSEWGNGAFTKAMIEGLSGAADREKLGYVEAGELDIFVRRRVMKMTDGQQIPRSVIAPEMKLVLLK
jgi:caspase domain-containing protein